MAAVSLAELFERFLWVERAAQEIYRRLAGRLAGQRELAALVLGLADDERQHLELIRRFRDSLPPRLLAGQVDPAAHRQVERAAALLEGDPLAGLTDFGEAYEFIHEFENHELVPLLRLLEGECRTEGIDCTAIMMVVEQHLARLDAVASAAGDRFRRRAIRL